MNVRKVIRLFVAGSIVCLAIALVGCPNPSPGATATPPASSGSTTPASSIPRVLGAGQTLVAATGICTSDDDCVLTMGSHSHCGGGCYPFVTSKQLDALEAAKPDPFGAPGSPCPTPAPCAPAPYRDIAPVCDRGMCAAIRELAH